MQKRAEDVIETRQRIIEATFRLHGTLGPAGTTIAGIAEEAGVTRLTVYRHFPDDVRLFDACSSLWLSRQQLPDPGRWAELADPVERLRTGLGDVYRFYRGGASMLTLLFRDWDAVPEAHRRQVLEDAGRQRDVLLQPFRLKNARRRRARAVVGHAVAFSTWQSLCGEQGLTNAEVVDAMVALVTGVAESV